MRLELFVSEGSLIFFCPFCVTVGLNVSLLSKWSNLGSLRLLTACFVISSHLAGEQSKVQNSQAAPWIRCSKNGKLGFEPQWSTQSLHPSVRAQHPAAYAVHSGDSSAVLSISEPPHVCLLVMQIGISRFKCFLFL